MGRKLSIHLTNEEIVSFNRPLKEIAPELLADERFSYCHNSIIVNMDQVENLRDKDVILKTGSAVPISRRCREFKSRYISYCLHKSGSKMNFIQNPVRDHDRFEKA
jgi:DNA-binding LytR/AlgR family response regulator